MLRKLRGARTTLWDRESPVKRDLTNGSGLMRTPGRKQYRGNIRGSRPRRAHANREEKCVPHDVACVTCCEDY